VAFTALLAVTVIVHHRFNHEEDSDLDPDDPVAAARLHVDALLARQSVTYTHAAAKYSLKTGRAPPRNYDKWFTFAQAHSCLIDEYDQIYRDFAPFYQLAADDPLFFRHRVDIVANVRLVRPSMRMPAEAFPTQSSNNVREAGVITIKDGEVYMPKGVDLRYWGGGPVTFSQVSMCSPFLSGDFN
jgi:hypothetical protein